MSTSSSRPTVSIPALFDSEEPLFLTPAVPDASANFEVDDSGYGVPPLPFFDARATAHPLASLMQRIRLTGDLSGFRKRVYVYATKWEGESPFGATFERVRNDPSWTTHVLDGAHNLMRDCPADLLRILIDAG